MQQLKLYRYSQEYLQLCRDYNYPQFAEMYGDKVYTCLGEFAHAPGHVLMVEFGTWQFLPGMPEIDNFEELEHHPDDFSVTLDAEE